MDTPTTTTYEIADGIYRLSTWIADVGPGGFTFNQYLVDGDDPLLFHTGPAGLFPLVSEAVARVMPLDRLRWISFGHVEGDECGATAIGSCHFALFWKEGKLTRKLVSRSVPK